MSDTPETLYPDDVLGDGGLIANRMPGYESRPQQLEMAHAVAKAIATQQHLVVEAGTGVGKSFAYLVPAILAATQSRKPNGERRRIVISTHTIALQEQLIGKDIPFLNAILPVEFSAVLVKGRSNYISLRRMHGAMERAGSQFDSEPMSQLRQIRKWADETGDGSLADLSFRPLTEVWEEVQSEHGNCLGKRCSTYNDCLYYRARRRVWNADILVVNHAMFFSDLALRREGASVLPDYDVAIFDEAHTVEEVAGAHLGISITNAQLVYNYNKLYNDRTQKGILLHHQLKEAQQLVLRLRYVTHDFFDSLAECLQTLADFQRLAEIPIVSQAIPSIQIHFVWLLIVIIASFTLISSLAGIHGCRLDMLHVLLIHFLVRSSQWHHASSWLI